MKTPAQWWADMQRGDNVIADIEARDNEWRDLLAACHAPAPATAESPWAECERLRRLVDEAQTRSACHAKNAEQMLAECERLRAQLVTIADEAAVAACEKARVELGRVRAELEAVCDQRDQLSGRLNAIEWARPEVLAFARLMERQLRANDGKGGWRDEGTAYLSRRCGNELEELRAAIQRQRREWMTGFPPVDASKREGLKTAVGKEAADVANFAMMIADVYGALIAPSQPEPAKARPTIAELEAILASEEPLRIEIQPNGEIRAVPVKPPCEYCRDEGGKPECYGCKKVMP